MSDAHGIITHEGDLRAQNDHLKSNKFKFVIFFIFYFYFLTLRSSCAKNSSMALHWSSETRGFSECWTPSAVILQTSGSYFFGSHAHLLSLEPWGPMPMPISYPPANLLSIVPSCFPVFSLHELILRLAFKSLALYRKFETYISRNETVRPHSQFLHSCISEQFIYSHNRYSADPSWEYINCSEIHECGNWETEYYNSVLEITWPCSLISGNT